MTNEQADPNDPKPALIYSLSMHLALPHPQFKYLL